MAACAHQLNNIFCKQASLATENQRHSNNNIVSHCSVRSPIINNMFYKQASLASARARQVHSGVACIANYSNTCSNS